MINTYCTVTALFYLNSDGINIDKLSINEINSQLDSVGSTTFEYNSKEEVLNYFNIVNQFLIENKIKLYDLYDDIQSIYYLYEKRIIAFGEVNTNYSITEINEINKDDDSGYNRIFKLKQLKNIVSRCYKLEKILNKV